MVLKNKHILISGGSSGIGFALALLLLQKGSRVTICGRNPKTLEEAQNNLNSDLLQTRVCDISDYGQIEELISTIEPVDILINNAAIWLEGNLENNTPDQIFQTVHINLIGSIFMTRAIIGTMKAKNEGTIVNVSSSVGLQGRSLLSVYAATKFGIRGFTDSLKQELSDTNVKVIGFYPCGTKTQLYDKAHTPKAKETFDTYIQPEEMAEVLVFALEKQNSLILDTLIVNRTEKCSPK